MSLSREGNTSSLPVHVARLASTAGSFAQKRGESVVASALTIVALASTSPATAAANIEPVRAPERPLGECSSTGHVLGRSKRQIAMDYFVICQRDSIAQAAGVVGNLMQESTLQPEEIESGGFSEDPADAGSEGWGLAQWTPGSTAISQSREYGIQGPIYSLHAQLALIAAEMRGSSPTGQRDMLRMLKQTKDPDDAAESFEQYFEEGPVAAEGGGALSNRQRYARETAHDFGKAALRARAAYYQGNSTRPASVVHLTPSLSNNQIPTLLKGSSMTSPILG